MTDKQRDNQTEETRRQAAGELRGVPDGERSNGTAATEHTTDRRSGGQAEGKAGREGGERDTDGHAPGEWRSTERNTAAGREQREIRQTEVKKRDI